VKVLRVLHSYVGVRAEGMLLLALLWILIGIQALIEQPPNPLPPSVLHYMLPAWFRFALWVIPAAIAAGMSLSIPWSSVGLGLLTIAPLQRCASWLWSWLMSVFPGAPPGQPTGWYSALVWLCVTLVPIYLSHIPAQVRPLHRRGV